MSHPSTSQNGCSLEDCHTNLFALTDLTGIKWRKLTASSFTVEPLDDPVLVSFTRCMQSDILCAWRRVPRTGPGPLVELMCTKELWIFWYGDEPGNLRDLLATDLNEADQGSWDNGLSYECRTVLFKALHNLIERCLLSQHFVRIGKWFVQPHTHTGPLSLAEKSGHLSIRFSFFLHGESTVCASIDVRQHPPLRTLHPSHLAVAPQTSPHGVQVILAPYGLSGTLTGISYKDTDPTTQRLLDEWRQFYIIQDLDLCPPTGEATRLPPLVEVLVAGVRMRYPSCFVLVTGETEAELIRVHGNTFSQSLTTPSAPVQACGPPQSPPLTPAGGGAAQASDNKLPPPLISYNEAFQPTIDHEGGEVLGHRIVEKVWQDCTITSGRQQHRHQQTENTEDSGANIVWDYGEPMQKNSCFCSKTKGKRGLSGASKPGLPGGSSMASSGGAGGASGSTLAPKHSKGDKDKGEKSARHGRSSTPFHRRGSRFADDMYQQDMEYMITQGPPAPQGGAYNSPGNFKTSPGAAGPGQPSQTTPNSAATLPQLPNTSSANSGCGVGFPSHGGVDSPHSGGAPSPLVAPQIPPQNGGDPTMPTLSPHPPSKNTDKDLNTSGHLASESQDLTSTGNSGASAVTSNANNSLTSVTNTNGAPTDSFVSKAAPATGANKAGMLGSPPYQNGPLQEGHHATVKVEGISSWLDSQLGKQVGTLGLKRPALPINGYDEADNEHVTQSLYDFDSLNAWLDQPFKRIKTDMDSYSTCTQSPTSPASMYEIRSRERSPSPQQPPHDPYEFSDDASSSGGNFGNKRGMRHSRDESFTRPSPYGSKSEEEMRKRSDSAFPVKEECNGTADHSPATPGGGPPGPGAGNSGPAGAAGPGGPGAPQDGAAANTPGGVSTNFLTSERDLVASLDDLEKLFDTDDSESSDADLFHPPTSPTGVSKLAEEVKPPGKGDSLASCVVLGGPTPHELAKMYPTPPSMENQHNDHSPPQGIDGPHVDIVTMETGHHGTLVVTKDSAHHHSHHHLVHHHHHHPHHYLSHHHASHDLDHKAKDWSFVSKPPTMCMFVGSSKYAPVELPSSRLDPLSYPAGSGPAIYKPSWQQQFHANPCIPIIDKHPQPPPSQYVNLPSIENPGSVSRPSTERMTSIEASPANFQHSISASRTPRTPMSYELQSPASNASSYMNRNLNSVDNHPTNSQLPEVHALVVNIFLSDSLLNLFKDTNFDSCPICVCNTNIKGSDVGLYLPDRTNDLQFSCICGFSAAVNRSYGFNSGLFYEDEVDITGLRDDRFERRKPSLLAVDSKDELSKERAVQGEDISQDILMLLQGQFSALYPSSMVLQSYKRQHPSLLHPSQEAVNRLEMSDGCEAVYAVLEVGRQAMDNCSSQRLEDPALWRHSLATWPYLKTSAKVPTNSQDVVRMLKSLQPLLQDAIQKKRTTRLWESVYTISGPLSWKDFHLLAGRGAEERSEPQPIPPLTVGHDKEALSIGPHAIRYWDKLLLEPFSRPRDVVYVVVAPDNDFVLTHTKRYFQELSCMYEQCRLGKHQPFTQKLRDGIMRIGKASASKVTEEPVTDWFRLIVNSPVASKLRMYSKVCCKLLSRLLTNELTEKGNVFDTSTPASMAAPLSRPPPVKTEPSSMSGAGDGIGSGEPPSTGAHNPDERGDGDRTGDVADTDHDAGGGHDQSGNSLAGSENTPCLVVYMVDPFSYGQDPEDLRLAVLGILRCFQEMLASLPEHLRNNTQLQIVPQQSIIDFQRTPTSLTLKGLCLSVYSQSRRLLKYTLAGRSLTGFGPAAAAEQLLKQYESEGKSIAMRLYAPPFVLTEPSKPTLKLPEPNPEHLDRSGVLFCGYCLSEDQRWLLASCMDNRGELLETCTINIEIPNRNRRKKASARRIGLAKLWDFILAVISQTARPWRLVVGRFGRLGHGELKGWAGLLSKKNLHQASRHFREMCNMCNIVSNSEMPQIISACLVSMENHSSVHIMTDSVKMEERMSGSAQLHTPRDASCTHILVFPTSATAQAGSSERPAESHGLPDAGDLGDVLDFGEDEEMIIGMNDFFMFEEKGNSPPASPSGATGRHSPTHGAVEATADAQDDIGNLHQQPLAMGFYVSSAKPGPLPRWFMSASPKREESCPVCFKAALHIHLAKSQSGGDDLGHGIQGSTGGGQVKDMHPLDSNFTCDVLRYVLETYNALSWLTIDITTGDRRSCLPAHLLVLMQLYQALNAFI